MNTDTRVVYSAKCSWFGPIQEAGVSGHMGLPCCPHCGSPLFEVPSKEVWDNSVSKFDKIHPGYKDYINWLASLETCLPFDETVFELIDTYVANGGTRPEDL